MILIGETEVYREIPVPVATLSTTHPTRKGLGSKLYCHSENQAEMSAFKSSYQPLLGTAVNTGKP